MAQTDAQYYSKESGKLDAAKYDTNRCTGFLYFRPTNKSKHLLKAWNNRYGIPNGMKIEKQYQGRDMNLANLALTVEFGYN